MTYYPTLHTLRGFAALWVLLLHTYFFSGTKSSLLSPFFKVGWLGVDLFYLLSAFLLGIIYFKQRQNNNWSLSRFYKKRFLRIFPAYYFQLAIILASSYWGYYKFPEIKDLIAHLFMFFNLPPSYTQQLNGVWWTLPVEFSFYLILPLMGVVVSRIGIIRFLLLSLSITLLYKWGLVNWTNNISPERLPKFAGQLPGSFFTFALGLSAAYAIQHKRINLQFNLIYLTLPLIIVWCAVILNTPNYWTGSTLFYYWRSVIDVLFIALVLSIYKSKNKFLNNIFFTWLGKVSYGIYLWHLPVILVVKDKVEGFIPLLIITVSLTLVLASFSYYFIEKKFSKLNF